LTGEGIDADTVGSVGPVDTVGDVGGGGLIHKARHPLVVESPERIRRGQLVVTGVAVILMLLPHIAFGRRLGVELELMNVDIFAEPLRSGSTRRGCRASRLNT
jgi:hypothetical protein